VSGIAQSPLLKRAPGLAGAILTWAGAIACPVVLFFSVRGLRDPGGLRLLIPCLLIVLPAALLRRRPLPALALMLAGSFGAAVTARTYEIGYLQIFSADTALCLIVATRARWIAAVAAAIAFGVQVLSASYYTTGQAFPVTIVFAGLTTVTAWAVGLWVGERARHADAMRTQAAAQAVMAERLRIARELHDVIAHSIGIIAIQAGMGRRVIDTQPAQARAALDTIEVTSRETLAGLRRTLTALRRAEPGPAHDATLPGPAPGLADLGRLAESTRDAGVRVDVQWRGPRRPLPADIDLSAFRIIQEAVTNVVRHAGTGDCQVFIDQADDELTLQILDDGTGGAVPGAGYGITGMRERASLLHGQLVAGPRPEGGFLVTARLPVPAAVR
jgi:signal transduction histidine kinase